MRLECTPEKQCQHNDFVQKKLQHLLTAALLVVLGGVGLEAALILTPAAAPPSPTVVGPDGKTVIGAAVAITKEFALTDADVPPGSQLSISGTDRIAVERVRTENLGGAKLLLLHLQTPITKEVPLLRMPQNGEQASVTVSAGHWEGSIVEQAQNGIIEAQPAISIGAIGPIIATADRQIIGISASGNSGDIPISTRALLIKFPELKR
jgi:hypothetical protein